MAHQIKSMMYKGMVPWHGLGVDCNAYDFISSQDALTFAGADYEIEKVPLFTIEQNPKTLQTEIGIVPDTFGIRNARTRKIYGTCGNVWQPLQNKDAFKWFDPFLEKKMAHIHTAGVLGDGENTWILAQINAPEDQIQKNDFIERFILLNNKHQAGYSISVGYTPIRVVCANTLAIALKDKSSGIIRMMHSSKMNLHLETLRDTMNLLNQTFEATVEQYRILASKAFKKADVKKYIIKVFDLDETAQEKKIDGIIEDVERLYLEGKGKEVSQSTPANWWNLYNAVNEYLNYEIGSRTSQEKRLDSLWFGSNQNLNHKALTVAKDFANAV